MPRDARTRRNARSRSARARARGRRHAHACDLRRASVRRVGLLVLGPGLRRCADRRSVVAASSHGVGRPGTHRHVAHPPAAFSIEDARLVCALHSRLAGTSRSERRHHLSGSMLGFDPAHPHDVRQAGDGVLQQHLPQAASRHADPEPVDRLVVGRHHLGRALLRAHVAAVAAPRRAAAGAAQRSIAGRGAAAAEVPAQSALPVQRAEWRARAHRR